MNKKTIIILGSIMVLFFLLMILTASPETDLGEDSLREPLPLKLRYKIGETLYYRLVRNNTYFQMEGSKFGELKAIAYFLRTRMENDNQGRTQENFTWKSFEFGQSMRAQQPVKMSSVKEAENFALNLSVEDEDVLSKLDFSPLPRTIQGLWFMIMAWDAITFDGPVRPQNHFRFPDAAFIGAETHNTRGAWEFPFEYLPFVKDSKYYFSGKFSSKILGVTVVKNIPCAIIEFAASENRALMNLHLDPVKVQSKAFEHFWGKTYLSLEDGRIVKGGLHAPTAIIQDLWMANKDQPEHSEYFALQNLELDLLTSKEFDSELKE